MKMVLTCPSLSWKYRGMEYLIIQEVNSGRNQSELVWPETTAPVLVYPQHSPYLLMVDCKQDVKKQQIHRLLYKVKCLPINDWTLS